MRYWISAMLLATTMAMPAYAQDRPQDGQHDDGRQGDGRHDGGQRPDGGHPDGAHQGGVRPQGGTQNASESRSAPRGGQPGGHGVPGGAGAQQRFDQAQARGGRPDGGGDWHGAPNERPNGAAPSGRPDGRRDGRDVSGRNDNGVRVWQGRPGGPQDDPRGDPGYRGGRQGYAQNGRPDEHWDDRGRGGDWNRGWRQDRRYDWQGWRNGHRDIYRGGGYRPPRSDWRYRRFSVGIRIDPIFYARNYWISNPGYYRLPPAYGSYRWIRYYSDALLIDLRYGTVVDAIPDFFY